MRHSSLYSYFLDFSCSINPETKEKLFAIADAHPIIQNHPIIKELIHNPSARISISQLAEINQDILLHSVTLAKKAATETEKQCLRAVMEQNVLAIASTAISSLIMQQFQNDISRLSKIAAIPSIECDFENTDYDEDIDYLKELERAQMREMYDE